MKELVKNVTLNGINYHLMGNCYVPTAPNLVMYSVTCIIIVYHKSVEMYVNNRFTYSPSAYSIRSLGFSAPAALMSTTKAMG